MKEFEFESSEVEVTVKVSHYKTSKSEEPSSVEELKVLLVPNSVGQFTFRVPSNDGRIDLEVNTVENRMLLRTSFLNDNIATQQAVFVDKESGKIVKARLDKLLPFKTKEGGGHAIQVLLDQERPRVEVHLKSVKKANLCMMLTFIFFN